LFGCIGRAVPAGHTEAGGAQNPLDFRAAALGAFHFDHVILATHYKNFNIFLALMAFKFIDRHDKLLKIQ
jgi:hypothetical protein